MKSLEYPTVRWARDIPDSPAIIFDHSPVSYGELETLIVSSATSLRAIGVVAGDRVVISGANSLEWIVVAHALARLGAVHMPLGSRIMRSQADTYKRSYAPRAILSDQETSYLWEHSISIDECVKGDNGANRDQLNTEIDPEVLNSIVQTSGSEGSPKGVCLSFRNHLSNALASALNLGVRADDRWLLNLPMDRIGGLAVVMRAALYGTTVVVHSRFDAKDVWGAIDEDRVTQLSLVATTLRRTLDAAPERRCPLEVRSVLVGGGPVPASLIDEARDRGFPILPTYGLTETSSQIATLSPTAPEPKRHTAGYALPLAVIEIRNEKGSTVPMGEAGQIHVRGPMVAEAYWGDDGQITSVLDSDGWLVTNDIGAFDADGYLSIKGRIDNVIVSGGVKTHAEEIENVLMMYDAVSRAVVIGVDDPKWGQTPLAFVELKPEREYHEAYLIDLLAARLPKHKCPCRIEVLDAIPTLPSGKPDRQSVRLSQRT